MGNLFISHSSLDGVAAKELQRRLEERGHRSVFLDFDPEAGIQAGVSWERTLYTKLRACRAVIALCSDSYLTSQWCFAEIALARMEGKEIFVLQIDPWSPGKKMPSILAEDQFLDLRTHPDEGYRRLWKGFQSKGIVATQAREWRPGEPAYPGLRAFGEHDASIFFGRDDEIREGVELLNRVRRQGHPRLVMVLGSSGSGKSSMVRAGIVPQLRRDRTQWLVVPPLRPGHQPAHELALVLSQAFESVGQSCSWQALLALLAPGPDGESVDPVAAAPAPAGTAGSVADTARDRLRQALMAMEMELSAGDEQLASTVRRLIEYVAAQQPSAQAPSLSLAPSPAASPLVELALRLRLQSGLAEASVVLVIDQFEELLGHDAAHPASRFLALLRTAMEAEGCPLLVIGTMRSDHLGVLQRCPPLLGLGFKSLSVGPMSKAGMRQVIEEPARLGQIDLQSGFSDLLLDDTETSDALPLLAFTLRMMWDRYHDKRLFEVAQYRALGGLQGAVAQVADETLEAALMKGEERDLRDAFLSLARPAGEGSGWVRRATDWAQLGPRVQPMLQQFVEQRLLVKRADGTVEVAHEALFRSWARLRGWLDENAEGLHLQREVQVDAGKWQGAATEDEKGAYLWRAGRLARAVELRDGGVLTLQAAERAFIDASHGAERAKLVAEEQRRQRELRRTRIFAGIVATLLLFAIAGVVYALREEAHARQLTKLADSRRLAAASLSQLREQVDLALLLGVEATGLSDTSEAVSGLLRARRTPATVVLHGHRNHVKGVAFSPDGTRQATAGGDGNIILWDAVKDRQLASLTGHRGAVNAVAFSPDGMRLASAGDDTTVVLWDLKRLKPEHTLTGHGSAVNGVAFSRDGAGLASASSDKTLILWDARSGAKRRTLVGHESSVTSVAFSVDDAWLASGSEDHRVMLWQVSSGKPLHTLKGHRAYVNSVAFSPDGALLASGSADRTIILWDARKGGARLATLEDHDKPVKSVSFSPDSAYLASSGTDKKVMLWDIRTRQVVQTFEGHGKTVNGLAFQPDGARLASAGFDNKLILWNLRGRKIELKEAVNALAFSADGMRLASGNDGSTVLVTRTGADSKTQTLRVASEEPVRGVAFSPDGAWLAASADKTVSLWDARSGAPAPALRGHSDTAREIAFSPDSSQLASGSDDQTIILWSIPGGHALKTLTGHQGSVRGVAFSRDGLHLASGSTDNTVKLWDTKSGQTLRTLEGHLGFVHSVAFSPDGTRLATGSADKTIILWDAVSGRRLMTLKHHQDAVRAVAFSRDGTRLASGGDDHAVMLWDAQNGKWLQTLDGHRNAVRGIAFSPDGTRMASGSQDRQQAVIQWDARSGKPDPPLQDLFDFPSWQSHACGIANRNLSQQEWNRWLGPHLPYRRTCPQLPAGEGVPTR